ncbi:MAG TPA: hypothetical protein VHB47_15840 [Thermoanaerobaculia bacterium]|jgi:hypothetical protein|nr:hypothetical protein [Thermoanaerobaculia bacterium]
MSTEDDNGPDERLQRELARLPRELAPPKGLEARVVAALRERGRLAAARPRPNPWRLGGAVAASLALLLAGFLLGRQGGHRGHPLAVPSYLLMLRPGADFNRERLPEARMTAETAAWARRQLGVRHFVVGEKLDMDGWVLKSSRVAGMSPMDLQDAPDGFFVIAASSDQEALGIARSCPFLRYGGRIELRRIHPT